MTLVKWRDRGTGEEFEAMKTNELEAIQLWGIVQRSENIEPVSIYPEPNWSRYRHG